jgi:hypothetical protein
MFADTPPPTSVKVERLDGEKIRVTVNQPPPDVTRIDWLSRTPDGGTWGVGRPVEPMSRVFELDGFRRYRTYQFEVRFLGRDGWSKGTRVEFPPAPFVLGPSIDMGDLTRRGWVVERERKPLHPMLITRPTDFDGDHMAVHVVSLHHRDGAPVLDNEGKPLGFRVEVNLPKGVREAPVPVDKLIAEALARAAGGEKKPKDPGSLVLVWLPNAKTILRREHLRSGSTATIYYLDPRHVVKPILRR